jgi:hypothetical protein
MTITIAQRFKLIQVAMEGFLNETSQRPYYDLLAEEAAYFAAIPIETFWSPDLPPLDHRMRQAIGKLIAKIVVEQAQWYGLQHL